MEQPISPEFAFCFTQYCTLIYHSINVRASCTLDFNFYFASSHSFPSEISLSFEPKVFQYFVRNCFLWFNELYHRYGQTSPVLCFAFNLPIDNRYSIGINGFEYEFYDYVEKIIFPKQQNPCETSVGVSCIVSRPR